MTIGVVAMLAGIFLVPALLLSAGHRFRRRSLRTQSVFWGALAGHLVALVVGTCAALVPAEQWAPDDVLRGALALWSFLLLPFLGGLVGLVRSRHTEE